MRKAYGQRDVSNWILLFNNNIPVKIDTVNRETITYYVGGDIEISIRDCLIRPEFLHLIRKGNIVTHVKREYNMRNIDTLEDENFVDEFDNLVIVSAKTHGEIGEVQAIDIYLKTV